ncbi:MAG: cold shock domain-containing protein [Bacteroidetes bacterium]|nr:MAG: cold shock domain-containing protein [Bacteroidota bacterium]
MLEGRVKWFNENKGYGFISVKGQSKDVFAHINDVHDSGYDKLYKSDIVEFELVEDRIGRTQAVNITAYEPVKSN